MSYFTIFIKKISAHHKVLDYNISEFVHVFLLA